MELSKLIEALQEKLQEHGDHVIKEVLIVGEINASHLILWFKEKIGETGLNEQWLG